MHFFDLAELAIHNSFRELHENADDSMLKAAAAALKYTDTLPNSDFSIPEMSPVARGTGRKRPQEGVKQFPGESQVGEASSTH
jgi:acyl-CoA dehydrogenase family member 9